MKLKVLYARIPSATTSMRFVVQVTTPISLVPEVVEVPMHMLPDLPDTEDQVQYAVRTKYKELLPQGLTSSEHIECDLLVPK